MTDLSSVLTRIRKRLFHRTTYIYYRLDLLENTDAPQDSDRLEVGRYDALLKSPEDPDSPRVSEAFRERAAGRCADPESRLYTIFQGDEVAHWGWMTTFEREHRLQSVASDLKVSHPSAILVDFYTEAAHRRNGFYEENIRKMLYDASTQGIRYVFIATRTENFPSRRVIEKVGFAPFRVYTHILVLGGRWTRQRNPREADFASVLRP